MMNERVILKIAYFITLLLISAFVIFAYKLGMPDDLNEIGDSLSGLASSLAFTWIVAGLYLQQYELAETRREFQRLGDNSDFEKTNSTLKMQVESLNHVLDVFREYFLSIENLLLKTDSTVPSRYHCVQFFIAKCAKLEKDKQDDKVKKLVAIKDNFNVIFKKYEAGFDSIVEAINASQHEAIFRKIYIDSMIYSEINMKIKSAKKDLSELNVLF